MCNPTNISAIGPFRVDLCDCGSLHVHLGPATVRLTPEALPHLTDALQLANERLPVVQRGKAPPPVGPGEAKREAKKLPTFPMACPACGARMRLLEKYYGTIVRCPDCNKPFQAGEGRIEEPAADED